LTLITVESTFAKEGRKDLMTQLEPMGVIRGSSQAAALLQEPRRQLLGLLAEPDSAAGLARKLGLPRQRVNYHLRELEREHLVECVEERRKGNCVERIVRATARSFVISPEVLGALGETKETVRDRFSAAYLMSAAARTIRDVASIDSRARHEGKRIATFTAEAEIRFASADARAAFAEELANTLAALVAKYHDETAAGGRPFRVLAHIHPSQPPSSQPQSSQAQSSQPQSSQSDSSQSAPADSEADHDAGSKHD
jgi:DNA-binding transcriptional ArsR family regulator